MKIKTINNKLYKIFQAWCEARDFPVIGKYFMPKQTYMVFDGEKPIIAGCLYHTGTGFCFTEWIVANPDTKAKEREEGFNYLVDHMTKQAKKMGAKIMVAMVSMHNKKIIQKYTKNGFKITDQNMVHVAKEV